MKAVALTVALLMFVACSSGGEEPKPQEEVAESSPTPTPDPTCPLTGAEPGSIDLERAAVAVKIENSPQARPQSGLQEADVVFEEIVEGGITRFMAIYHCGDSERAGPVRSARFDDPKIASPYTKFLAFSGANDIVLEELDKREMFQVDEDTPGGALFRDPPGVLEVHNLFADTTILRDVEGADELEGPAHPIRFGDVPEGAADAKRVKLNFTSSITIEYRWKGDAWKRWEDDEPFVTIEGDQIAPANVLIQEVRVDNSESIFDVAGNPSPDIDLASQGRAFLFRDGKVIEGAWTADKDGIPEFVTIDGDPFVFATGTTWIELVPSAEGNVKGKFKFK